LPMKRIYIALIILAFLLLRVPPAYAEPPSAENLVTDAKACILIDSQTGQVLYEQNADLRLYPASTTKMMTAILAIENAKPGQVMTASQKAINEIGADGMNIGIMQGEKMTMEQLLKPLLISSANEAANILSENVFSSQSEFIDQMNKKAQEIGAVNTHFVNPNGMHDPDHYTTARDLSTIARYAMSLPVFRNTVCQRSYQLGATNKHSSWPVLYTSNPLLYRESEYFTKVTGIKTGYTSEAGHNLVSAAANDKGMELIAVVLGVSGTGAGAKARSADDCEKLLEYGFQNYGRQNVIGTNQFVKKVSVKDAKDDTELTLVTAASVDYVLPYDKSQWNIVSTSLIPTSFQAPIQKGEVLGSIEYRRNGVLLGKTDVIAANSVEISPITIFFKKIRYPLIGVVLFFILGIIFKKVSRSFR